MATVDDFSASPGVGWTDLTQWQIAAGEMSLTVAGVNSVNRCTVDQGSDDQYVETVIPASVTFGASYSDVQLAVRLNDTDAAGYGLVVSYEAGGGNRWWLRRYLPTGGNDVVELTDTQAKTPAFTTPATVRLEVEGNVLTAYLNGTVLGTYTDSSAEAVTTGAYAGVGGYRTQVTTSRHVAFDRFETAPLGAPPAVDPPTGLAVASQFSDQLTLTWDAVPDADGYTVQRETRSGGTWGEPTTHSSATTTYVDNDFDEAVATRYRVSVTVGGETSAYSSPVMSTVVYPDDRTVWFDGATLPTGWSQAAPVGSVDLAGEYLRLVTPPGASVDSISNGVTTPQGPLVWCEVSGSFDFAVALAEEPNNLPNQGIDLLALTASNTGARFCNYSSTMTGTSFRGDHKYYVYDNGSQAVTGNTSQLYGAAGWLRLRYDESASTFTFYQSRTGLAGSWVQISSHTTALTPERFAIHANAAVPDSYGREQRIAGVVDMLARPAGDVEEPPGDPSRTVLSTFDGSTVPGAPESRNNGSVSVVNGNLALSITDQVADSHAGVVFTGLPVHHGLLLRYRVAQGYTNAFWVPGLAIEPSTTIDGAVVVDDKWGKGNLMLMEMPARVGSGTADRTVRMLRRSPVPVGQAQTGSREFDGYSMLIEDLNFPIDTDGSPWTWMRFEKVGNWYRARVWYDGQSEPTAWDQMLTDHARRGTSAGLALGSNDSQAGGSNTATVEFSDIQVYQVDLAPPPPAQVLMPSGQTVDASLSVLMPSGTEVAVESTQVLMPG